MIPGQKPVPTNLKVIRGNPRKENLKEKVAKEPKPAISTKCPRPPRILKGDKIAQKEWKRLAPQLHDLGLLTELDLSVFERYCMVYSQWLRTQQEWAEEGNVCITNTGRVYQNPKYNIAMKLAAEVRQLQACFGLDPSSRTRVKAGDKPEEDPFESFMRKKG